MLSVLQRATGEASLTVRRRGRSTVIADLLQRGCLKLRFPRAEGFEAVLLNSSGGVAGGDTLETRIQLGEAAAATLSTQAAERFYRVRPEDRAATVATSIDLTPGAQAEWLPQETILFDGSALHRRLDVAMAEDARFLGVEALVFGRTAMGERMRSGRVHDTIRITRGGRLVLHDAIRLAGNLHAALDRPAVAAGARAVATLVLVAPDAAARLDGVRAALASAPVEAGASAWNGMLVARLLGHDGACLRAGIVAGLAVLRDERPLPRVWMC